MERHSEYEDRLWESQCRLPSAVRSRSAVSKLRAMPPDAQTHCIVNYAQNNLPHLLRCALTAGVSPDTRWGERDTPVLCLAAERGSEHALEALLVGRANVSLANKQGWTAAHVAAYFGHAPCLRLLLDAGAPKDAKNEDGWMPLHYVAQEGHAECCSLLVASGSALDSRNNEHYTPLLYAAQHGHLAVIRLLLDAGAQLEAKGSNGRTALGCAAHEGHGEAVKLLLARGANANAVDMLGNTPLMDTFVIRQNACLEALLPVSDLSITNRMGRDAFHISITSAYMECFELLLPLVGGVDMCTVPSIELDGFSQQHSANTALLDLLAGRGPAHPPGTVCDGCGRPETEVQLHPCSGCWSARYCGSACNAAAWPAHKAECKRLQAEREERSTPTIVGRGSSSAV